MPPPLVSKEMVPLKAVLALACDLCAKGVEYQNSEDGTGGHVPSVGVGELDECDAECYRALSRRAS